MIIPQTFAQINFGGEKVQAGLRGVDTSDHTPVTAMYSQVRKIPMMLGNAFLNPRHTKKAIITTGVLAAVLYPSMTDYVSRARDMNRMAKIMNLSLAIMTYQRDNDAYPPQHQSGCFPYGYLLVPNQYIRKDMDFSDPKKNFIHDGCNDKNVKIPFAYRVFKDSNGQENYILSANMENKK